MIGIFTQYLRQRYFNLSHKFLMWKARWGINFRWGMHFRRKPHKLPSQLIVSLTSYPPRFNTLPLTLKCLLTQTIIPDRLILWIAHQDKELLTIDILSLQKRGLEILYCDDLKSYKKIIPTLQLAPDAFIVTTDDDVYYWPTWLEELTSAYKNNSEVLCHRAHKIRLGEDGLPLAYNNWDANIKAGDSSPLNFPTGVGGVMYPPFIFHTDVQKREMYEKYCERGDDIWLYWMVRLNGGSARKVGIGREFLLWPDTQQNALWIENGSGGGNDRQIHSMISKFGFPLI